MIPILYSSIHANFPSNKTGQLAYLGESTYCVVEEAKNGIYECELRYPVSGKYYSEIQEGRYIVATHDEQNDLQPFKIYKRSAPMNGIVTFYAHHLSYALSRVVLEPFTATTPAEVMTKIPQKSINTNPFSFTTSKSGTGTFKVDVPTSVKSILGGTDGSVLDAFGGGEYEFDVWQVKLYPNTTPPPNPTVGRGSATNVTIRYGKNLMNLENTVSTESTYDAVVPFYKGSDENSFVMLTERVVARQGVTNPQPIPLDLTSYFEAVPTESQLRTMAQAYLTRNEPWSANNNITVDFVQLWQSEEYKDIASLQRVRLCDFVSVYYPALGVVAENIQAIRTVYNVLKNRYDKMELGNARANFIEKIENDYNNQIREKVSGFEAILKAEINHATELLTDPGDSNIVFGGRDEDGNPVYGKATVPNPREIFAINTVSPSTATEVLRINKNGIGFAKNINGPYSSAWTLDGHFIADYITAGTINANIIRTGILSDYSGVTWSLTSDVSVVSGKTYYKKVVKSINDKLNFNISKGIWKANGTIKSDSVGICTSQLMQFTVGTPIRVVFNEPGWVYSTMQGDTATSLSFNDRLVNNDEFIVNHPYVGVQFYKSDGEGGYEDLSTTDFVISYDSTTGTSTDAVYLYEPDEYVYAIVENPTASELGTYYEPIRTGGNYWNLETGDLVMSKGSIDIGNGVFHVSTTGALTCTSADIRGTFQAGSTYWIKLDNSGRLVGGSGNTQYGYIDFSADVYDIPMDQNLRGIQIQGDILRINTYRIGVKQSTDVSQTTINGGNGNIDVIHTITDNGDGTITWTWKQLQFINGIMCTEL